jgi:hypothetical protein
MNEYNALYWSKVLAGVDVFGTAVFMISTIIFLTIIVALSCLVLSDEYVEVKINAIKGFSPLIIVLLAVVFLSGMTMILIPDVETMEQMIEQNRFLDLRLIPHYLNNCVLIVLKYLLSAFALSGIVYFIARTRYKITHREDNEDD